MKMIKRVFKLILILFILLGVVLTKEGYDKYKLALEEKPLETVISELREKENYTEYKDIPKIYFEALVAVEDRRFYQHAGFDIIGTLRALYTDIKEKQLLEGGSTISQQLAKNLYFPQDDTLKRKIAEILMALKIENKYDKEEILEFYVNGIYYGSGHYSIYDAAQGYFDKEPHEMNEYECTLLVGVPNAPAAYSPDNNLKLAHKRQDKVVRCMVDCDYITQEQAEEILENR